MPNSAPSGTDGFTTIVEDTPYILTAADFSAGFSDPDGNGFAGIVIASPPTGGTLYHDADGAGGAAPVAVVDGQFISAGDLDTGRLSFTPDADLFGSVAATIYFSVRDDGGTDNGGADTGALNYFDFDITGTPDAPALTGVDASVSFAENLVNAAPQVIDADVGFTAPDNNFDGGTLVVTGLLAEDYLSIQDVGFGSGEIGYDSTGVITYEGVPIGIVCGCSGDTRTIQFNGNATGEAIDALIQNLTYGNTSDAPTETRILTLEITDADGNVLDAAITITVSQDNDAPVATLTSAGTVGGEILVNSATADDQVYAQSTALSNGGFVVTWTDFSAGQGGAEGDIVGGAIKAQLFAADGTPVGTEILVNTTTVGDQLAQTVTTLAGGGFVVAWEDDGGTGGDTSLAAVRAQVFANDGTRLGGEILVNSAVEGDQFDARVTALSGGGFVVTWTDTSAGVGGAGGDASSTAVKAQAFAADGTPVGGEILVNGAIEAEQGDQQVAGLANGGFVIIWTDSSAGVGGADGDSSTAAVKAQVFAADGTAVGTEILVNTATDGPQFDQKIIALSNGGFAVAWTDFSGGSGGATGDSDATAIKLQLFNPDGSPVGSEILVNTSIDSFQLDGKIVALAGGGFVVTWLDASSAIDGISGLDLRAQVFATDGTPVGSEILVNSVTNGDQVDGKMVALADGGFLVTWEDDSKGAPQDGGGEVKGQLFSATGARIGGEFQVNSATIAPQGDARPIALSGGGFAVVWNDLSQGVGGAGGDTDFAAIKAQVYSAGLHAVEQTPLDLKGHISVTDADAAIDGGDLTVQLSVDSGVLNVTAGGSGAIVNGSGTDSVSLTGTIEQITALLGSDPTSVVDYLSTGDAPPATVTLALAVDDNGNSGAGSAGIGAAALTIDILPVDDAAVAVADSASTSELAATIITVLGNDTDVDGGARTVANINGTTVTAGQSVTLASGAIVTLNADGTLGYDPNGKFAKLITTATAAATGATNHSALDSFSYALDGGASTTVTVTVNGETSVGDRLHGDAGANILTGTSGPDRFDLSQGGDDIVSGADGSDSFRFGGAFTLNDYVDGGVETDQILLQGDYTGGNALTIGGNITNVEAIALAAGSDYTITMLDAAVPAGQALTINAGALGVGDDFTFNGAAEANGIFALYGGLGIDNFTGGGGNDLIVFGAGQFNPATDHVDGGAGKDVLVLNGSYTLTVDSAVIANIEKLVLAPGTVTEPAVYNITLANNWVGTGETKTVDASAATGAVVVNATAETDGKLILYGGSAGDLLKGGSGDDWIFGGAGADTLNGRVGADVFAYTQASQSNGISHDTIVAFDAFDRIDLQFAVTEIDSARNGALSNASFDANLATAFSDLGAYHAATFNPDSGDLAGHHFLVIDANGVAGYQAGQDMVIELIAATHTIVDTHPFI